MVANDKGEAAQLFRRESHKVCGPCHRLCRPATRRPKLASKTSSLCAPKRSTRFRNVPPSPSLPKALRRWPKAPGSVLDVLTESAQQDAPELRLRAFMPFMAFVSWRSCFFGISGLTLPNKLFRVEDALNWIIWFRTWDLGYASRMKLQRLCLVAWDLRISGGCRRRQGQISGSRLE